MKNKPNYLRVYRWKQIDSDYNDIPVFWCEKCLSLNILYVDSNMKDIPEKYCDKCLGTEITVGHIFNWLEIQPKRPYKNLKEYLDWKNKVDWADKRDSITIEIEEEINNLYQ